MSLVDKNKIFFGMVKYILSEQRNVDWVFKTSIMSYQGAKQTFGTTSSNDLVDSIVDFIYEVKPYHVHFTKFQISYDAGTENINLNIKDTPDFKEIIRFDNNSPFISDECKQEIEEKKQQVSKDWLYTTMANRIATMRALNRKEQYTDEEMAHLLRTGFKGNVLNGGDFSSETFGYDILLYDLDNYDSPTIVYDYLIKDFTERFNPEEITEDFTYTKKFAQIGDDAFSFEWNGLLDRSTVTIIINKANISSIYEIRDYSLISSGGLYQITLAQPLAVGDKLFIYIHDPINNSGKYKQCFCYETISFIEQDTGNIRRKIIPMSDEYSVEEPEAELRSKKLYVVKQLVNGTRAPFENYISRQGQIIFYDFADGEHILLTAYDYQYLYDIIISPTDPNLYSNNTINYNGDNLLRPHYEKNRPSELAVTQLRDNLIIKNDNIMYKLDFKNDFIINKSVYRKSTTVIDVIKNAKGLVSAFKVADRNIFPVELPFHVLVGTEIIRVNAISNDYFTNLTRGCGYTGLYANSDTERDVSVDDIVYEYDFDDEFKFEKENIHISYQIKDINQIKYLAEFGSTMEDEFEVYKMDNETGIPELQPANRYTLQQEKNAVFGPVEEVDGKLYIYDILERLRYIVDDKKIYDPNGNQVGMVKKKYLYLLSGKQLGFIEDGVLYTERVSILLKNVLEVGDVYHFLTIKTK